MPYSSMKNGIRYSFLATLVMSAMSVVIAQSSPVQETFNAAAERWGVWAALSLLLVGGAVYALYQQSIFIQRTLVSLLQENQRCMDRVAAAIKGAPCGSGIPDSDNVNEATPTKLAIIERQRSRKEKREG